MPAESRTSGEAFDGEGRDFNASRKEEILSICAIVAICG